MNCLVVDDDELTRIDLENKISKKPFLNLVGSCTTAVEAAEVMMKEHVDVVFLDVMMPGMTGLEFIESLSSKHPQIILVTSERKFAAEAFEYDVTDFLVKPVSEERFFKAVMRASGNLQNGSLAQAERKNHLFVKVNNYFVKIDTNDILYIEAQADYVTIHTSEQRYTVHSTMKTILDSLPPADFCRVHNSYIVRLDKISRIEDNVVIIDKKLIPVSRARVKPLMKRLNLLA